jgi:uncharacterized membrane protein
MTYFQLFLYLHIAAGTVALTTGTLSMMNRKGGKTHTVTGLIFFWAMVFVFITSVYMSFVKSNWFLFVTGFFSFYMAASGYRSIYLKKVHLGQKPSWVDWMIGGGGVLFAAGMYYLSYRLLTTGNSFGIVPMVFGSICLVFAISDLRKFFKTGLAKTHWINSHAIRMGGAYTATITAFLVVNIRFQPNWIVWVTPSVVMPPIISYTLRKYLHPQRKQVAGAANQ